jgi:PIN domain
MIVDASAVLAILLHEEDAANFAWAIEAADALRMSVVNYAEAAVRIDRFRDDESSRDFDDFMLRTGSSWTPSPRSSPKTHAPPTAATAGETTQRRSISAIALRMPWRELPAKLCCSRARTSRRPTYFRRCRSGGAAPRL